MRQPVQKVLIPEVSDREVEPHHYIKQLSFRHCAKHRMRVGYVEKNRVENPIASEIEFTVIGAAVVTADD